MRWAFVFSIIFTLIVVTLLVVYWFLPINSVRFVSDIPENSNFTLNSSDEGMQFYPNLRYVDQEISYKIYDECTIKKEDDMMRAFGIIENRSVLQFNSVGSNEEISVTCSEREKPEGDFFIAGEGGPVNITRTDNFNVISKGSILLIRDSKCANPNIAIHELFHALGFGHSSNQGNIMYKISRCEQTIGDDMITKLNEVYSYPSEPDLSLEDVSASMRGKYLDINLTVRNHGLAESEEAEITIFANGDSVKSVNLEEIKIGFGRTIHLTGIWIPKINVEKIRVEIKSDFSEIDKNNNEAELQIKK